MAAKTLDEGRYEVVRALGAGGAGQLFLVLDRQNGDKQCALKVLRPRERDPALVPLFREEFLVLSAIDHPSVVKVLDFGVLSGGEPYFTMDFVPGETARVYVDEDRLEPVDYIDLCAALLGALTRIHAQRILHRDIKPENIILRRDQDVLSAVLVDFGLAAVAEGTVDAISGTPPYIAPEVVGGATPDERSDLFGLGLVLYEICTGKRPGDRAAMLRDPNRTFSPDRLRTALNRGARGSVPKRFEEFVVRLLAAQPAARYPSARAALQGLASIYHADIDIPAEELQRPSLSAAPPLVGRRDALAEVLQRVDALGDGKLLEPVVVVAGRSGFGVTRLMQAIRHQAAAARCRVVHGASLLDLFRSVMTETDEGEGLTASELVFRMDLQLHESKSNEPPALLLDNVESLDDAEAEALRDWIAALEAREGRSRLLLVLGGCNEGKSAGADLLRSAGRAVPHDLRDLAPLSEADIRSALSVILGGAAVPSAVSAALYRASGGSPRAFCEMLDLLVNEKVLRLQEDVPTLDEEGLRNVRLPDSVLEVARARASTADDAGRAALSRFALLPDGAPLIAANRIVGASMEALLREGLLVRAGPRISFPYETARRALDVLEGTDRQACQEELAALLREEFPYEAARLLADAGNRVAARTLALGVAERLIAEGQKLQARQLLHAVTGDEPDEATAALYLRSLLLAGSVEDAANFGLRMLKRFDSTAMTLSTVQALMVAKRFEDAKELLDRRDGEETGLIAARLINARAAILMRLGELDLALETSKEAERIAGGLSVLGGRIAAIRGQIYRTMRWHSRARAHYCKLLETSTSDGDRKTTLVNIAVVDLWAAATVRSMRIAHQATRGGDFMPQAYARQLLAEVLQHCGRHSRALSNLEQARGTARRAAQTIDVAASLLSESEALLFLGRPAEGEARLARAETLPGAHRLGDKQMLGTAMRALFAAHAGRTDEAREMLIDGSFQDARWVIARARVEELGGSTEKTEKAWRAVIAVAAVDRDRVALSWARVGLAAVAASRGAWHLTLQFLDRSRGDLFTTKTPLRARSLMLRAAAALHDDQPAASGRWIEESIAVTNRCDNAPLRAEMYATAASLLEEPAMQRFLRKPTASAAAALLEVAREVWAIYGNETMLRKIDLHLAELPRAVAGGSGGPQADRLVKVLHISREMNREFDRDRLLGLILDRAIELTGAERGFVILLEEGREQVRLARNIDRESISEPEQKVSSQIIREVIETGRIVRSEDAEFDSHFEDSLSVRQLRLKSIIAVPLRSGGRTIGAIYLDNRFRTANFTDEEEHLLELFADQAVAAIDRSVLVRELKAKTAELKAINKDKEREIRSRGRRLARAETENRQHRRARGFGFERLVARSAVMKALVSEAQRLAESDLSLLFSGESGTGKELLARATHYASKRQDAAFVAVNCAAFAEGLLEPELFGHVRGSFSGAERDRPGLFEEADGGTLFLDEVGEMSLPMQVKLLRALELGEVRRLGESNVRLVDVRVLSATNADLDDLVRKGRFREDLKYRLMGAALTLPPLRDRLEDLEPLAQSFLEEAAQRDGGAPLELSSDAAARLESYSWPGNVRELRNVILRSIVAADDPCIGADDIMLDARSGGALAGLANVQAERVLDEVASLELNTRQQGALMRALTHGKLSFAEYQRLFRVSKSTTSRDLDGLVEGGLLHKRGKTRATVYLPGPKLREIAKRIGLG